jgi:hypothetical protein
MLAVLPELLADLPRFRPLWEAQDQHLDESLRWIESGRVSLRELPELDLAIVDIPDDLPPRAVRRYLAAESVPVHPFAIHRATGCNRLLRIQGARYELQYRYDSWVQLATRRPLLRASLEGLAAQLNARETAPGTWRGEPVTDVVPRLYLDGTDASAIPRDEFLDQVAAYLQTAPVAWDPYDWHGD